MTPVAPEPPEPRVGRMAFLGLGMLSLLFGASMAVQEGVFFPAALLIGGLYHGLLFVVTVPLWRLTGRLHERPRPRWLVAAAHVAMMAGALVIWQGLYFLCFRLVAPPVVTETLIRTSGLWLLMQAMMTYTIVMVAMVLLHTVKRLETERRRAAELRALARESELTALRAQLRPHFIFNVLNSIYALIPQAPDKAQEMVDLVADLIRRTLEVSDRPLIPLDEELGLVERYLAIEGIRLGDRLKPEVRVDSRARAWPVPPLLLQPIVENAIKHGAARDARPGTLAIEATTSPAGLDVLVRNHGPAPSAEPAQHGGRGLSITRRRLLTVYGQEASFALVPLEPTGAEARVHIPAREDHRNG